MNNAIGHLDMIICVLLFILSDRISKNYLIYNPLIIIRWIYKEISIFRFFNTEYFEEINNIKYILDDCRDAVTVVVQLVWGFSDDLIVNSVLSVRNVGISYADS